MYKKDVVLCYTEISNGILLSHKRERNWVICRDADGLRVCHTYRLSVSLSLTYLRSEVSQKEENKYHMLIQTDGT